MVRSQALLQREHGVAGTALPDVLAHSGAPRGSIYHHFPEGRSQLAEQGTEYAAAWIAEELEQALAGDDLPAALDAFVSLWMDVLKKHDFAAGCAVAAGALDAAPGSGARRAAGQGFQRWESLLRDACRRAGIPAQRAGSLAVMVVASIEGAILLARAEGSTRPLEQVAGQLRRLLADETARG